MNGKLPYDFQSFFNLHFVKLNRKTEKSVFKILINDLIGIGRSRSEGASYEKMFMGFNDHNGDRLYGSACRLWCAEWEYKYANQYFDKFFRRFGRERYDE